MTIELMLARNQAIMKDENPNENLAVTAAREIHQRTMQLLPRGSNDMICHHAIALITLPKIVKACSEEVGSLVLVVITAI